MGNTTAVEPRSCCCFGKVAWGWVGRPTSCTAPWVRMDLCFLHELSLMLPSSVLQSRTMGFLHNVKLCFLFGEIQRTFKLPDSLLGVTVLRVIPKAQIALSICFLRPELHTMGDALALKDLIHGTQPSAPTSFTWLGLQRAGWVCRVLLPPAHGARGKGLSCSHGHLFSLCSLF